MRIPRTVLVLCFFATTLATENFTLTSELLDYTEVAVELSRRAFDKDPFSSEYFIEKFRDRNDQALIAKVEGSCYAAFRGTLVFNLLDLFQNVAFFAKEVTGSSGSCRANKGFAKAYNSSFKGDFEASLRQCSSSCGKTQCPVILTGHSQGGSIATVAAIALADLEPTLITFGQMAAIRGKCPLLDQEITYLRFERSCRVENSTFYDLVPNLPTLARQRGQQLLLGEDGKVDYVGKNTGRSLRPSSAECHSLAEGYFVEVKSLRSGSPTSFGS